MSRLADKMCVPCERGKEALKGPAIQMLADELGCGWKVVDEHHLMKEFRFSDFRSALRFANKVGDIAEEQGHHPELLVSYGKVRVEVFTHSVKGLTENDFVLAAKVEESYERL